MGDRLRTARGIDVVVSGLRYNVGRALVYTLTVARDHTFFVGAAWDWSSLKVFLVPLLALPQATHYVLDGFVWRRRSNPQLSLFTSAEGTVPRA